MRNPSFDGMKGRGGSTGLRPLRLLIGALPAACAAVFVLTPFAAVSEVLFESADGISGAVREPTLEKFAIWRNPSKCGGADEMHGMLYGRVNQANCQVDSGCDVLPGNSAPRFVSSAGWLAYTEGEELRLASVNHSLGCLTDSSACSTGLGPDVQIVQPLSAGSEIVLVAIHGKYPAVYRLPYKGVKCQPPATLVGELVTDKGPRTAAYLPAMPELPASVLVLLDDGKLYRFPLEGGEEPSLVASGVTDFEVSITDSPRLYVAHGHSDDGGPGTVERMEPPSLVGSTIFTAGWTDGHPNAVLEVAADPVQECDLCNANGCGQCTPSLVAVAEGIPACDIACKTASVNILASPAPGGAAEWTVVLSRPRAYSLSVNEDNFYFVSGDVSQAQSPASLGTRFEKIPWGPAAKFDLELETDGLEVTQGIQNMANDVPLVKGRKTYVRAYVKAVADSSCTGSSAGPRWGLPPTSLRGFADGVELPGSPLAAQNQLSFQNCPLTDWTERRSDTNRSLLFELPNSWTQQAEVQLEFEIPATLPEAGTHPNKFSVDVVFEEAS